MNSEGDLFSFERSGNLKYHHSKLLERFNQMSNIRIEAEVHEKTGYQVCDEIREYQRQFPEWDYKNGCRDHLRWGASTVPCRFLVLPADLSLWKRSDPTTHRFRLYFLCDVRKDESAVNTISQHMHISDHPGYSLRRPREFFQVFGSYTLLMLNMARQGASHEASIVPPLDAFEILWSPDPKVTGHHLTKDTIRRLIVKSIDYLQKLRVPTCVDADWLSMKSVEIKDFLVIPEGGNPLGGLYRNSLPDNPSCRFWTCYQHGHQWLHSGTLEALVKFVHICGGHIDIPRASLNVELRSRHQAEHLCVLIKNTGQKMDVSIKIGWNATSQDLDELLRQIIGAGVLYLELDGVTQSMHPQGCTENRTDLLYEHVFTAESETVGSVTLLNYPRPQEQHTYLKIFEGSVYKLHSKHQQQQPMGTKNMTANLDFCISSFGVTTMFNWGRDLLETKAQHLQRLLAEAGYHDISTISVRKDDWQGEFSMKDGTLLQLQVRELWASEPFVALKALGSLRTLTVNVDDLNTHREDVVHVFQASSQLQELIISLQERCTLESVEKMVEIWQGRSSHLHVTLVEHGIDGRSSIVTQVVVGGHPSSGLGNGEPELQESISRLAKPDDVRTDTPSSIEFLQWNSDQFSVPLTDFTAALLNSATEQFQSVLTTFVLDVSSLNQTGLFHVQNVLQRSVLRRLHLRCTAFDPSLKDIIRHALLFVQWPVLQSLVLFGPTINDWIQLLVPLETDESTLSVFAREHQLQHLRIQGSGRQHIFLSHSSALFVHQLAYSNPSMELILENVSLQDNMDWDLLPKSLRS